MQSQRQPRAEPRPSNPDIGQVFGVVKREGQDRNYWNRIGTAFKNRDGSINVRFDFLPMDPSTTIQIRFGNDEQD